VQQVRLQANDVYGLAGTSVSSAGNKVPKLQDRASGTRGQILAAGRTVTRVVEDARAGSQTLAAREPAHNPCVTRVLFLHPIKFKC
jgi:hypothetical protein